MVTAGVCMTVEALHPTHTPSTHTHMHHHLGIAGGLQSGTDNCHTSCTWQMSPPAGREGLSTDDAAAQHGAVLPTWKQQQW